MGEESATAKGGTALASLAVSGQKSGAIAQSRGSSTALPQGHGLIFTTPPVRSSRGWSTAPMRHGVSTVRSGHRHALGLVFHDAK